MKSLSRVISRSLLLGALLAVPISASADPIYDFSTLGEGSLGTNQTVVGPVTVNGYYWNGAAWVDSTLWSRNTVGDNGLGVCSEGATCTTLGGDANELSQLTNTEAILLTLADGYTYSEVWLSSLDANGTGGEENGIFYWGNSANIATLLAGPSQSFDFGDLLGGGVEGLLPLDNLAGVASSKYLLFIPGSGTSTLGSNEDYLVWGVSATVPDGGSTLALLGLGLLGVQTLRRKFGRR